MHNPWSQRVSNREAYARAGGARRYQAERRRKAEARRLEILRLLDTGECGEVLNEDDRGCPVLAWGTQARLARRLGVSRYTISFDMRRLFGRKLGPGVGTASLWKAFYRLLSLPKPS